MKIEKNETTKMTNENINGNDITDQSRVLDRLHNPSPRPNADSKYDPFDFEINQEFIEENKKRKINLVRPRQNYKQKFAPYTRSQRRKRRMEVYKLHFEHGVPATRIAEMINVDRNTINNDLKILYREALKDYNPEDISLDHILQKQLVRLETQRDRLALCLSDTEDINNKIAIERLIADIDFKLFGALEKIKHNTGRFWEEVIKKVNKAAEDNKMDIRYTSLFEISEISPDSRKSLNKIKGDVFRRRRK